MGLVYNELRFLQSTLSKFVCNQSHSNIEFLSKAPYLRFYKGSTYLFITFFLSDLQTNAE